MEFTGERIVPGSVNDDLLNEHLCRYRFAQLLVEGKAVLDVGSGVGYGAKILAEKASKVIAVDLSEEAVRYAGREYAAGNIEIVVGDAQDLPLAGDSVDVAVSFELVEHLQGQQAHLLEISRVLKPEGWTVISTPNRIFYSQESDQANPFHTREFDFQEFYAFLKSVFSSVEVYYQNHTAGLIIGNPSLNRRVTTCLEEDAGDLEATSNYFVAICTRSREFQPALGNFCLLPGTGNLLRERQQDIQRLEGEASKLDNALTRLQGQYDERTGWALQLNRRVKSRDQTLMRLREEFEERSRFVEELSSLLEAREKALGELQSKFEDRTRWAKELSSLLEASERALGELQSEFEDRTRWAKELSGQLKAIEEAQLKLQSEFEDRTEWALRLDAELQRSNSELQRSNSELQRSSSELQQARSKLEAITQSKLYKLARLLGLTEKFEV